MKNDIPNHVAIIMDGNGRWATRQGKKRTEGHYAGYKTLKKTALHILSKGVKILSVFAFSWTCECFCEENNEWFEYEDFDTQRFNCLKKEDRKSTRLNSSHT